MNRTSPDCSYGFRPGRSAQQALDSLRSQLMSCRGGYVLEVDIRKFFDNLDHGHSRTFLQLRVRDGVLLQLIGKWLDPETRATGGATQINRSRQKLSSRVPVGILRPCSTSNS